MMHVTAKPATESRHKNAFFVIKLSHMCVTSPVMDSVTQPTEDYPSRALKALCDKSVLWRQISHQPERPHTTHLYFRDAYDRNNTMRALSVAFETELAQQPADSLPGLESRAEPHLINNHPYYTLYVRNEAIADSLFSAFKRYAPERIVHETLARGGGRNADTQPGGVAVETLEKAFGVNVKEVS